MIESTPVPPQLVSRDCFLRWSKLAVGYFAWLAKTKSEDCENSEEIVEAFPELADVAWHFSNAVAEWQDAIIAAGGRSGYSEFRPLGATSGETIPIVKPTDHECLAAALSLVVKALSRNELGSVDADSVDDLRAWSYEHSEEIRDVFRLLEIDPQESQRMISAVIRERSLMKTLIHKTPLPTPKFLTVKMVAEKVGLERKSMSPYEKRWKTKPANRPGKHNGSKGKFYPRTALVSELETQFPHVDFSDWSE